jgi:hypothetical protein
MTQLKAALQHWLLQPDHFSLADWRQVIEATAPLSFQSANLEVDGTLWGTFWQGDVIAPGYLLPALELAFLRATRLDKTLDDPDPLHYLHRLQQHLIQPPAAIWISRFEARPILTLAFNAPPGRLIIWLSDEAILGGYQEQFAGEPGYTLIPLLPAAAVDHSLSSNTMPEYLLDLLPEWQNDWAKLDHPVRLDRLVQLQRAYGYLKNEPEGVALAGWFADHR